MSKAMPADERVDDIAGGLPCEGRLDPRLGEPLPRRVETRRFPRPPGASPAARPSDADETA